MKSPYASWALRAVCLFLPLFHFAPTAQLTGRGGGGAAVQESAPPAVDPEVVALVRGFLASAEPDVRSSALEWIARDPRAQDDAFIPLIFGLLQDGNSGVRNQALANLGWIYERRRGEPKGQEALAALKSSLKQTSDRAARLVVIDLLRGSAQRGAYDAERAAKSEGPLIAVPELQAMVASFLANPESTLRPELLSVVEASRTLQSLPAIVNALGQALEDDNLTVRSNTADLLITIEQKADTPARALARPLLLKALEENDPNVQLRVAKALALPIPPRKAPAPVLSLREEKISTADIPFDFNYYTAFVQPLFAKRYGNTACLDCHTPQANASGSFRILPPDSDGRFTLQESRINFASMLSVIDRSNPEHSKLLLKPLDPRTQEGEVRGLEHDGGVFWANQYDPDFQMVQGWLKGAKIETPPDEQLSFTYFVRHVEPIFSTPGPDGFACINCHSTHAILHLESPETAQGKFSIEQLVNNYQCAHRVIDEAAPSNSFIVRKPTSPREGEAGGIAHAGGIRWPEKKESWQYKTLVTWMGMKNLSAN